MEDASAISARVGSLLANYYSNSGRDEGTVRR